MVPIQDTNLRTEEKVDSVKGSVSVVNDKVDALQLEGRRKAICKWLSAPDPSSNYDRGRRSRQANTGFWFIKSEDYLRWKKSNASMLWLHGKPGCGKSVLSSTIISELRDECQPGHRTALAYFFFDFNDAEKQTPAHMVRSLIAQLFTNTPFAFDTLEALFLDCSETKRQPDLDSLLKVLKIIISEAPQVYFIIDALDECSGIREILSVLTSCQNWNASQLHTLLTSRRLRAIEDTMERLIESRSRIDLHSDLVNQDISTYVYDRLLSDPGLQRWRNSANVQEEIRSVLTGKADGMYVPSLFRLAPAPADMTSIKRFRWAVCQLDILGECPNLPTLRKALNSLPKTLDETYARVLNGIPEIYRDYALTILRWLTFCARPLKLCEFAEIITINTESEPWVDETLRFPEPLDLLTICSSLVRVDKPKDNQGFEHSIIRLAHFSVKEFLMSERIRVQPAATFWLEEISSHELIASSCLAYLLTFNDSIKSENAWQVEVIGEGPLYGYAGAHWTTHVKAAGAEVAAFERLSTAFLRPDCEAYKIWVKLFGGWGILSSSPLFQMVFHGVARLVDLLLELGADVNEQHESNSVLWLASRRGNEAIVRSLLQHGADVDIKGKYFGTPLQVACSVDAVGTVYALLDAGAAIDGDGGGFGTGLQAAASIGSLEIVKLLISRGADVNFTNVSPRPPLAWAALKSHFEVVQYLLQAGADPNVPEGQESPNTQPPLQAACASRGAQLKLVEFLLRNNANINTVSGRYGTALQAACSYHDNFRVVRLLLKNGANIRIQGGKYGTPLQAVCAESHDNLELAEFLLEKGADVNVQGGKYCTALQAACSTSNQRIANLLLDKEADISVVGGKHGSALHAACAAHSEELVLLLLRAGANPNLHAGKIGTALQVACFKHFPEIVALLLENGADVNARGGSQGTALKVALVQSKHGTIHVTRILLEHGARDDDLSSEELGQLERKKQLYGI